MILSTLFFYTLSDFLFVSIRLRILLLSSLYRIVFLLFVLGFSMLIRVFSLFCAFFPTITKPTVSGDRNKNSVKTTRSFVEFAKKFLLYAPKSSSPTQKVPNFVFFFENRRFLSTFLIFCSLKYQPLNNAPKSLFFNRPLLRSHKTPNFFYTAPKIPIRFSRFFDALLPKIFCIRQTHFSNVVQLCPAKFFHNEQPFLIKKTRKKL